MILISVFLIVSCGTPGVKGKRQRLCRQWELQAFEEPVINKDSVSVIKTTYPKPVYFKFEVNGELEVDYSDSLIESYVWKFVNTNVIKISPNNSPRINSKILGEFEVHFLSRSSNLFLQRRNTNHNGIMLVPAK
ncbi:MAG: hypothetical protein R3213_06395 [Flavobacteriaceae bacterium]|nr:hypothetical protein [Flavobacteriaceae bacterium]